MAAPAAARVSLREYQLALSERLQNAGTGARLPSRLGVQVGSAGWLVELQDAGEVIPVPPISPVPLARPWFKGVTNVRGNLYSVTDFSAFLGGALVTLGAEARLLLLNERFHSGAALLVGRSLGLRAIDELTPQHTDGSMPWVRAQYTDLEGHIWKELDVAALVHTDAFLETSL